MNILITGATGNVGSLLIPRLVQSDQKKVRAMVHEAGKGEPIRAVGAEVVVGDYEDADSLDRAMTGIETLFLVTPRTRRLQIGRAPESQPPSAPASSVSCAYRHSKPIPTARRITRGCTA